MYILPLKLVIFYNLIKSSSFQGDQYMLKKGHDNQVLLSNWDSHKMGNSLRGRFNMEPCPVWEKEHDFIAYWALKPLFLYLFIHLFINTNICNCLT